MQRKFASFKHILFPDAGWVASIKNPHHRIDDEDVYVIYLLILL